VQKQLEEIDAEVEHLNNDSSIECEHEDQTNSQLSGDMLSVPNNVCAEPSKSSKTDRHLQLLQKRKIKENLERQRV